MLLTIKYNIIYFTENVKHYKIKKYDIYAESEFIDLEHWDRIGQFLDKTRINANNTIVLGNMQKIQIFLA